MRPKRGSSPTCHPLFAYVHETRRFPLLSREEEYALAVRYRATGDVEAAHQLATGNLRLVVKIANDYRPLHGNVLDLVQEGNLGLLLAIQRFDPARGVRFASYAGWWIRAFILRYLMESKRIVRMGTTQAQRRLFFHLRKEEEKLRRAGIEPIPQLLAERLRVTEEEVAEMDQRLVGADTSLDLPVGRGEVDGPTRVETLSADERTQPDVRVEDEEFRAVLRARIVDFARRLQGRDRIFFFERWLSERPPTLSVLGRRFGVSRERARQIERRVLGQLKHYLEAHLGTAVDANAPLAMEGACAAM